MFYFWSFDVPIKLTFPIRKDTDEEIGAYLQLQNAMTDTKNKKNIQVDGDKNNMICLLDRKQYVTNNFSCGQIITKLYYAI